MARRPLFDVLLDADGRPALATSFTVVRHIGGGTPNVYAAETGGSALTATDKVTDSRGRIKVWVDETDWPLDVDSPRYPGVDTKFLGPTGPQGVQGVQGIQGPTGPQGPAGAPANLAGPDVRIASGANIKSGSAAYLDIRTNYDASLNSGAGGEIDQTKKSWAMVMDGVFGTDFWIGLAPAAAGNPVYATMMKILAATGVANFPNGLQSGGADVATRDANGKVPESQNPIRQGVSLLEFYGHSLPADGGNPYSGYVDKLAGALSAQRRNNRGWGGSVSCWPQGAGADGGYAWVLQQCKRSFPVESVQERSFVPRSQVVGHHAALNDLAQLGSLNPRPMKEAHRLAWSRFAACYVHEDAPLAATGNTHSNTTLDGLNTTVNFAPGMSITGAGIPAGTTIASINSNTSLTLSAAATATANGVALTVSPWSETGVWVPISSTTRNSGTGYRQSTALNATRTFTVPTDFPGGLVVGIVLDVDADKDLTVGVRVFTSGAWQVLPDARLQGSVLCDQSAAGKHNAVVLRFGGKDAAGAARAADHAARPFDYPEFALAAGDQIELTLKTQTIAGSPLNVDCAHTEADPLDGPVILVPLPHTPLTYTLWNGTPHGPGAGSDPMNDGSITAWKAAITALAPEFPNRLVLVDMDGIPKNSIYYRPDGTHFTAKGMSLVNEVILDAVRNTGFLTRRVLSRAIVSDQQPFFEPVGTAGRTPFLNSWTNFGGTTEPVGYHVGLDNHVQVRGHAKSGSSATANIFQLPTGALPTVDQYFPMLATAATYGGAAYLRVAGPALGGNVFQQGGGALTTWAPLESISFFAEA